jgi:hypothetical protein
MTGITTSLVAMDTNGDGQPDAEMAILTPSHFDNGSSHSCGLGVRLSFSSNLNDDTLIVSCAQKNRTVTVSLWVTDDNGNSSFCTSNLVVRDTNNVAICPNLANNALINGRIITADGAGVQDVVVTLDAEETKILKTNSEGQYKFADLDIDKSYTVKPDKKGDDVNGISTLDLVLIQRHVLGLAKITDPYLLIAADINRDGKISSTDLVMLRKLILGNEENLPDEKSWLFVWAEQKFINPLTDELMTNYIIDSLKEDMKIDFVAIKLGDINRSATTNVNDIIAQPRSGNTTRLYYHDIEVEEGMTYDIPLHTEHVEDINGLQFVLQGEDLKFKSINGNSEAIRTISEETKISFAHDTKLTSTQVVSLQVTALRDGKLSDMIVLGEDKKFANEIYQDNGNKVNDIQLVPIDFSKSEFELYQNQPNPWSVVTKVPLMLPYSSQISYRIMDNQGKVLHKGNKYLEAGKQYLEFSNEIYGVSGNLILEVESEGKTRSINMIKVE